MEEIGATPTESIDRLAPGDVISLTRDGKPVSKPVGERAAHPNGRRPPPGLGKDMIASIAPDFGAPLDCMKQYME